jgi:hypothetical protein
MKLMRGVGLMISCSISVYLRSWSSGTPSSPATSDTSAVLSKTSSGTQTHSKPSKMFLTGRAYVSYNEKSLHVWKPDTEEQIFFVNFFDETKSHTISCIVYSARYHVGLPLIVTDLALPSDIDRFQVAHLQRTPPSHQGTPSEDQIDKLCLLL